METNQREDQERQHAEVTIRVALTADKEATPEDRMKQILRKIRLEMGSGIELLPPLLAEDGELTGVVSMDEYELRLQGEAESRAEAELDRKRERYFDEKGHF